MVRAAMGTEEVTVTLPTGWVALVGVSIVLAVYFPLASG
jgi:hypothetical protein